MQKFISKYALAAHLAILTVSPLFLFPFCGSEWISYTLFWLTPIAAVWVIMEPSRRAGEMLHDSRRRVISSIVSDPVFWLMSAAVVVVAIQSFNDGVSMAYDAERFEWYIASARLPILPGSVRGEGTLTFAATLSALVIIAGCRHALGKNARTAYLLFISAFAGIAAIVAVFAYHFDLGAARDLAICAPKFASYAGTGFGLCMIAGIAALYGCFERVWRKAMTLLFLSIGGTASGLFVFAPSYAVLIFLIGACLSIIVAVGLNILRLDGATLVKTIVMFSVSFALGVVIIMWLCPSSLVAEKTMFLKTGELFTSEFNLMRDLLSKISSKAWSVHPWLGTGAGSFPYDITYYAENSDWSVLIPKQATPLNGWWYIIVERGILGAVMMASVAVMIIVSLISRFLGAFKKHVISYVPVALSVIALGCLVAVSFWEVSILRPEVLMVSSALMGLATSSIPASKRKKEVSE